MAKTKIKQRKRNVSLSELNARLRNTADHLGAMVSLENEWSFAASRLDFEKQTESNRRFVRDYQAFLAASRTVRNFLFQLADASGCREWLDVRLSLSILRFFGEVANQELHDHDAVFSVRQTVRWSAEYGTPWVTSPDGRLAMPKQAEVTEIGESHYFFNDQELESQSLLYYEQVRREHGDQSAVILATRYYSELDQIVKNSERNNRFQRNS